MSKNEKILEKNRKRNRVPILAPGIGTRISEVAKLIGTRKNAADAAGISTDSLARYIRSEIPPNLETLLALSEKAGVSLQWLILGEGAMRPGEAPETPPNQGFARIDRAALAAALEVMEEGLQRAGMKMRPAEKAELAVSIYDLLADYRGDREDLKARVARIINTTLKRPSSPP